MRTLLLNIRNRTRFQLASKFENIRFYNRKLPRLPHNPTTTNSIGTSQDMEVVGQNPRAANNAKRIGAVAVQLLLRFCSIIARLVCRFVFGEKGQVMPPIRDLTLTESASSLAAKIRTQKIKSVDVVQAFIDRIKELNPTFNMVVDNRFEEALKEAAAADELIQSGQMSEEELAAKKPFLGVPISTKDCIRVKGMKWTAGIWNRRNIKGEKDAEAMALMREAGAIPFALTNVSEVCMWWESYNSIHGRSRNPYDSNRIVGGSSGGEGALLGGAGSPFGLGSDIGGSIRMPAFFNGIFGHKPSKYIVSIDGQYPTATTEDQHSFLSIGPMSRFATDLKPMMKIIAGANAEKLRLDEPVDLSKVKVFYQVDADSPVMAPVEKDIRECLSKAVKHFQETVKSPSVKQVKIDKLRQSTAIWMAGMRSPHSKGFDHEMTNNEGRINLPIELIKCLFGQSKCTLAGIFTAIAEKFDMKHGSPKWKHLTEKRKMLIQEMQDMLQEDGIFLFPCHPTAAPYHNEPLLRPFNFSYTAIINAMGMPACSIPMGLGSEGLPVGIQVVANFNQDRLCLAVACELERVFGGWVAPAINV